MSDQKSISNNYIDTIQCMETVSEESKLKHIGEIMQDKIRSTQELPDLFLKDVVDIARLYEGQGVYLDDLIQEGNIALLSVVGNLDLCDTPEEVESFITRTIMDAMEQLVHEQNEEDEIDLKILEMVNRVNDEAKELSEALLKKVTPDELAQEMGVDVSTVYEAIRLSSNKIPYLSTNED